MHYWMYNLFLKTDTYLIVFFVDWFQTNNSDGLNTTFKETNCNWIGLIVLEIIENHGSPSQTLTVQLHWVRRGARSAQ